MKLVFGHKTKQEQIDDILRGFAAMVSNGSSAAYQLRMLGDEARAARVGAAWQEINAIWLELRTIQGDSK